MTPLAIPAVNPPARVVWRFARVPLAAKLAFAFLGLVAFVLIVNGAIDTWLTYNQAKRAALEVEEEKARSAAERVDAFLNEIQTELGWTAGVEWGYAKLEQQRYDFIRLLRQAPAITALSYIDGHGKEQIAVSRLEPDSIGGGKDFSGDPRFVRAVADKIWFGPVEFRRGSEPYMTIALAHVGKTPGVTVADVNLKLVWDVVSAIHVGAKGFAYVVDDHGRLIAHPDLSLVLRDNDLSHLPQVAAALAALHSHETSASPVGSAEAATSLDGASVLTAYAIAPKTHWVVFVEQPLAEALATAYRSLARALALLGLGLALAAVSGVALARRMAAPIRLLRQGAEKLGAGDLSQRLDIRTGDEIEALAGSFNRMAGSLQESYETLEAKVEARTRDLEELLERQTATSKILEVIAASPADAGPVFEAIATSANAVMRGYSTTVFRIIEDRAYLMAFTPTSPEADAALRASFPVPLAEFSPFVFVNGGQSYQVADTEANDDPRIHDIGRARGFRSMIFTPLVHQGRSIGVIAVTRRTAGVFAPADVAQLRAFADQAVIAIQNARLFEEVQAKTRDLEESLAQQTATADVLKVISRSAFNLDTIFQTLVTSAVDLCKASSGTVCVRDGDIFRYRGMAGPEASAELQRYLQDHPIVAPTRGTAAGRAILSRQTEQISDVLLEEGYAVPFAAHGSPARSLLGVPLLGKSEVQGAIVVARAEPGAFPARHVEILRTFADQAVIAIENARLFEEVQAKTRDLEESLAQQTATADVLKVISRSAFDLQKVLDTLVGSARDLCAADSVALLMYEGKTLKYAAGAGMPSRMAERGDGDTTTPDSDSLAQYVVEGRRLVHVSDFREHPEFKDSRAVTVGGFRAGLGVPMLRDGEVLGFFGLMRFTAKAFSEREIALTQTFVDQAQIAIENARLFQEVQARTRALEDALAKQTATAEILRVISGSPTDANPVFASIVAAAARLLPCDLAFIMLVEGKTWWNVAAATAEGLGTVTLTDRYPVDPDLNFPSRAIVGKTTTYLPDWSEIELPEHQVRVRALNGINASIHLPFLREGECVGLLTLLSQSAHPFGAAEIAQAESFRDQALIAIENSRLFNETQEALKRQTATASELEKSLADLRKTQDRLVQSEKLASLGQLTAGIAHEIKNPLNFVNNFASLSRELLEEMKEALAPAPLEIKAREEVDELMGMLDSNLEKVAHHGKRADSIVKNMLLHSREGSGERARVDVNAMVEEAVGLGYHGARAEKPGFNVTVEKRLDPEAGDADLYLQEITRVLLNLVSNGFYATAKRKHDEGADYQPMLIASTRSLGARVEIRVRDNGGGIPPEVRAKMFNPFFTTKPAGEGTGLGLSLSHDIVVKQHGGTIDVETEPGSFTEFVITLPRDGAKG